MTSRIVSVSRSLVPPLGILLVLAADLSCQVRSQLDTDPPAAATILSEFERESLDPDYESEEGHGRRALVWARRNLAQLDPPTVDSLMNGLEDLALSGQNEDLRVAATRMLARFGSTVTYQDVHPGTSSRLARIYRASTDPAVRLHVVAVAHDASEPEPLIPLLTAVATAPAEDGDFPRSAWYAVRALSLLDGAAGVDVLREAHAGGKVIDPEAARLLEWLAGQGYRYPRGG